MRKTNRSSEAVSWPFESGGQKAAKRNLASASPVRQVLLLGNGSLFDEGLIDLLKNRPNLRVTHAHYWDEVSMVEAVVRHQPEVVVLILSKFMNPKNIVGRLRSAAAFHLQLVLLSLETIEIQIYEWGGTEAEVKSTKLTALKVEDFLVAINPTREF